LFGGDPYCRSASAYSDTARTEVLESASIAYPEREPSIAAEGLKGDGKPGYWEGRV